MLAKHRVTGLLTYRYERESEQEVKLVGRGRAGAKRQQQVIEHVRYQIMTVTPNEEAIAHLVSTLGWRAYVTNAPQERLSLPNAVREYRHEYHIERGFGRLKGAPLSIAPMFVKREDQVVGLTHLLSVAVRILTLMEFVVRRSGTAARGDAGWIAQRKPAQSHRDAHGRTALARLRADHPDPDPSA